MPTLSATKQASNRNHYLERLRELVSEFYQSDPSRRPERRYRLEGFVEAGLTARVVTRGDIDKLTDTEHQNVFGTSSAERQSRLRREDMANREHDWILFEKPTYKRHGPKRTRP